MMNVAGIKEIIIRDKISSGKASELSDEEVLIWLLNSVATPIEESIATANELLNKYGKLRKILELTKTQINANSRLRSDRIFMLRNFMSIMEKYYKIATISQGDDKAKAVGRLQHTIQAFVQEMKQMHRVGMYAILIRSDRKRSVVIKIKEGTLSALKSNKDLETAISKIKAPSVICVVDVLGRDKSGDIYEVRRGSEIAEWTSGNKLLHCYDYIQVSDDGWIRYRDTLGAAERKEVIDEFYKNTVGVLDRRWNAYNKYMKHPEMMNNVEILELLIMQKVTPTVGIQEIAWQVLEACGQLKYVCDGNIREYDIDSEYMEQLSIYFMQCGEIYKRILSIYKPKKMTLNRKDIFNYLAAEVGLDPKEKSFIMCVKECADEMIILPLSKGDESSVMVNPDEMINIMCRNNSHKCILIHTHPYAAVEASCNDIAVTDKLIREMRRVGNTILDHIIISGTEYISMRDEGLCETLH